MEAIAQQVQRIACHWPTTVQFLCSGLCATAVPCSPLNHQGKLRTCITRYVAQLRFHTAQYFVQKCTVKYHRRANEASEQKAGSQLHKATLGTSIMTHVAAQMSRRHSQHLRSSKHFVILPGRSELASRKDEHRLQSTWSRTGICCCSAPPQLDQAPQTSS